MYIMVKNLPKNHIFIILMVNFTLLMAACVQPVNYKFFMEDDRVQELINENNNNISINLEPIPDNSPTTLNANIIYGASTTITVGNAALFTSISWYLDGAEISTGDSLTVNSLASPFDIIPSPMDVVYRISVLGYTGSGIPYSGVVYVTITM